MSDRPTNPADSPSKVRFTYQDHQAIPEDHRRHEIIDGELYVTPSPPFNHQVVAGNLLVALYRLTRERRLGVVVGPITVHFEDELVLEPDVVFVRDDHRDIIDPEGDIHGPPDLVAEILSPDTRRYDEDVKRRRYLEAGVGELWIVDLAQREVTRWWPGDEAPETLRETIVWDAGDEAFEIPLEEIFRGVKEG